MGKKKIDRDIALKVLAAVEAVKDALADLMDTMFIIYQPKNWYGEIGGTVTFTVIAMNVATYRWQYSDNGTTWYNASSTLPGYNTDTMSFVMGEQHIGRLRRCALTDADGNKIYTDVVQPFIIQEGG